MTNLTDTFQPVISNETDIDSDISNNLIEYMKSNGIPTKH